MLTKSAKTKILKTNINELLNECLQLVSLDEEWSGINITKDFDPALGDAEIDPQDMLRVFFNIFKNANQAFKNKSIKYPADFIPELSITTKDRGHYIDIFIRDNGEGIPKDNIDKMFIPFFTTWPSGKGIGLGLPLAREIILNHGGAINISSVEDEYTEITINLPKRHLN
jgi:nitrogen-specific signal transduction histidine kinase